MLKDFISLFFPRCCQACDLALVKGEDLICLRCEYDLPKTESHVDDNNFIAQKFYGKIRLEHALAYYAFVKGGKVSQLLRKLKYQNVPELGVLLGKKYGVELNSRGYAELFDVIVPVPLHKSKLKRRGYNQSEQFALGLSEVMNIGLNTTALIRVKSTSTQTQKSRIERWKNVEDKFQITDPQFFADKRVLIVDDVVTTGSTLEACGQEILRSGCSSMSIAALAAAR